MNSVLFLSYGQAKTWMKKVRSKIDAPKTHALQDANDPLTIPQLWACGAIVGVTVSFVEGPVDLFKSQLQESSPK
jgi:hypothetical protein